MKRWIKFSSIGCIIICILFILRGEALAGEPGGRIRVLVPLMNDSGFVSYENGVFSGYYIDYLEEIAKYTSWEYDLVPIETYDQLLEACEKGDFDLMTGIIYSEEYDKTFFEYPKHTAGAKRYVFAAPKDTRLTADKEYSYLRGARIGIASNTGISELEERFRDFCFMYGISCASDQEEYSEGVNFIHIDPSAWREKIQSGEIDGILSSDAFCLQQDMYAITTFGLDQIYFVAPDGERKVMDQLDDALEKLNNFDPDYNDRLYEKYFSSNSEYTISFDEKEKKFLEQGKTFQVSLLKGYAPYSYINDAKEQAGMIPEVFRMISVKTNEKFRFEYRFYDTANEAMNAVNTGECDICGISMYSLLLKHASGGRRSTSFYSDTFTYYKNSGNMAADIKKTAILMPELPAAVSGEMDGVKNGDSPGSCLEQVKEGSAGYTILLSRVGDYYRSYYGFNSLLSYPVSRGDVMFCLAYAANVDQPAVSVIDKCLAGVDKEELDHYVAEISMFDHKKQSFQDYLKEHVEVFSLVLAGILLVICLLLVIIIINVMHHSRKIHELLYRDEITGGSSYKKFLEEAEAFCPEPGKKKLILYINISSFKYINDMFGYEAGNQVLCEVKSFLDQCADKGPFARIYADRFVAMIPCSDLKQVKQLIQEKLAEFEDICRTKYPSFNIWIKAGAYMVREGDSIQKAVNLANYAVDEIEKTSRNECVFYDDVMYDKVLVQKGIERDMWKAMEDGEFEAFYQPKYNIETKELVGAEALVRWRHPKKGLLPPGLFIPVFEKNHYIIQVDFYIFECVCRFLRNLKQEGGKLFTISSNFSRLHLKQPDFVDRLTEIVDKYQVPPEYLEIEITETVATENFDCFIQTIQQLKEKGFKVSIDDFGSGYSSIQLLYKIPIDVLKFDKAFVDNENVSEMESDLMDSIITVTLKNGIKIICEGVETKEQEEFVRRHNCIYVQGFLYSRPIPEREFRKLLMEV